jgi:hypothetical protein
VEALAAILAAFDVRLKEFFKPFEDVEDVEDTEEESVSRSTQPLGQPKPHFGESFRTRATEFDRGHEDFQSSNLYPEIGTHEHVTTSNNVVTRLRSVK